MPRREVVNRVVKQQRQSRQLLAFSRQPSQQQTPGAFQPAPSLTVHLYHIVVRGLVPIFGQWFSPWPK